MEKRLALLILLFTTTPAYAAPCVDPATLAASTVSLRIEKTRYNDGRPRVFAGQGSAWFLSSQTIVIIMHQARRVQLSADMWTGVVLRRELGEGTDKWVTLETTARLKSIVQTHYDEDLYVLQLAQPFPNAIILPVRDTFPAADETLIGIGYPDGRLRLAYGRYIGLRSNKGPSRNVHMEMRKGNSDEFVFYYGASGGPTVDCNGQVVGVISTIVPPDGTDLSETNNPLGMIPNRAPPRGLATNVIVPAWKLHGISP